MIYKCLLRLNSKRLKPLTKVYKECWWIMIWIANGYNTLIKFSMPSTAWTSKSTWSLSSRSHSTQSLSLYKREKALLGVLQRTFPNLASETAAKLMESSIFQAATLQACSLALMTLFQDFWDPLPLAVTWTWSKRSLAAHYRRIEMKNLVFLSPNLQLPLLNKLLKMRKIIPWK